MHQEVIHCRNSHGTTTLLRLYRSVIVAWVLISVLPLWLVAKIGVPGDEANRQALTGGCDWGVRAVGTCQMCNTERTNGMAIVMVVTTACDFYHSRKYDAQLASEA